MLSEYAVIIRPSDTLSVRQRKFGKGDGIALIFATFIISAINFSIAELISSIFTTSHGTQDLTALLFILLVLPIVLFFVRKFIISDLCFSDFKTTEVIKEQITEIAAADVLGKKGKTRKISFNASREIEKLLKGDSITKSQESDKTRDETLRKVLTKNSS